MVARKSGVQSSGASTYSAVTDIVGDETAPSPSDEEINNILNTFASVEITATYYDEKGNKQTKLYTHEGTSLKSALKENEFSPSNQICAKYIFINMEIFCGHHANASNMISNLGNYLRTGLAYGENLLTLSQELDHALSYINIMNYRFSHTIQVTVQIPDNLLNRPIVKCILQPLVENSLKHGFEVNTTANYPFSPFTIFRFPSGNFRH